MKLPPKLPQTPPAEGWWKQEPACPVGSSYRAREEHERHLHECLDDKGRLQGPTTILTNDGKIERDAWYRDGEQHGLERIFIRGRDDQSFTYVDGQRHGPADEYGDIGDYYRGQRHGRWKLIRSGASPQHGNFVRGLREGTWLSAVTSYGETSVVASAKYRKDKIVGAVSWWSELGERIASGKMTRGDLNWQFGKKTQIKVSCRDTIASTLHVSNGKDKVSCSYDDGGALARQVGGQRGVGCPRHGLHQLCTIHPLDPYGGLDALRSENWFQ